MKKNAKKLLSFITAGLFVLQSIPFMAVGASAAEELEARKYTPTLDGIKDEAYTYSYSYTETTAYGNWTFSFLYDDSYIYVLADIADASKSSLFSIGMSMNDPVAGSWDVFSSATGSLAYLVSNPFLEGYEIRHWDNPSGGSGWINMGANLGWQFDSPANAAEGTFVKEGHTSPATEFGMVVGDAGAVLEFRVAYNDVTNSNKVTFAVADNVNEPTSGYHKLWGANGATADNHSFTLGSELKIVDPTVVKKGTPVIDGVMENIWYDTAYINTLDDGKSGNLMFGWNASATIAKKLVEAGLIDSESAGNIMLNADGDFTTEHLTSAEVYFMWDDSNLYVFSKVYDNDIVLQTDSGQIDGMVDIADLTWDKPWLSEAVTHGINHNGNAINAWAHPAGACWDDKSCGGWQEGMVLGACDTITGNSLLHCYDHTSAEVHAADRDAYLGVQINREEGYYTAELCIPLSESMAASLLQEGAEFSYVNTVTDAYKKLVGTSFQKPSTALEFVNYVSATHTLSISTTEAVAPACIHEWETEPTVIKAATCLADGSQNYRCGLCGEVKPDSLETIPALGHSYADGICDNCGEKQPKTVYKFTPTLDGVMDEQYLGSAALTFEELVADSNFQVVNWLTDNTSIKALADAGLIELEKDADGNLAVNSDGYYIVADGIITPEDDITNEYLTKTDSYFLWDDEAIYIYSKVYDNDPLNVDLAFAESGTDLYDGIGMDQPWLNDVLTHSINPENNIYTTMAITGMAYGNAIWDDSYNVDLGGWSTISDFRNASGTLRRLEAEENIAATVNEEEGWYALEIRIPISDRDFGGTPLIDSFLQDGKQFTYNYTVTDGFKKALGSSFSTYHAANWTRSSTVSGTVFELSETAAEAPHIHELGEVVVTTEATCTTDGAGTQTCATCEEVIDVVIPALGHDIVVDAAVEATCTEDGLTEGSHCSRCEDATVAQEVIPATGHADENGDNVCDNCGESLGIPGDINGDGVVDVKDLTRLMKLIAGDETAVAAVNPDVNGDDTVDVKDLTRLMKAIAGEEVELH